MSAPRRGVGRRPREPQTFVVPYSVVTTSGAPILRPMVEVRLHWRGKPQETLMLFDSGADHSFLPAGMAESLGLDLRGPPRTIRGVGSRFEAREASVYLQIAEHDTQGRSGIPMPLSPVLVPQDRTVLEDPILGRAPFLERFEVTLRERDFVLRQRDV